MAKKNSRRAAELAELKDVKARAENQDLSDLSIQPTLDGEQLAELDQKIAELEEPELEFTHRTVKLQEVSSPVDKSLRLIDQSAGETVVALLNDGWEIYEQISSAPLVLIVFSRAKEAFEATEEPEHEQIQ